MSETSSSRPALWFVLLAALVAAAVWATVAMAAGGSGSSGTSSQVPLYDGPHAMFAADDNGHARGDCPNMGSDNGGSGGGSTTPSSPSTQDGSSSPSF
jgi:hypothetical protein